MFYHGCRVFAHSFRLVRQVFLAGGGAALQRSSSEEEIQAAFDAENADFARGKRDVYSPAITLWAFLSQVLNPGRLRFVFGGRIACNRALRGLGRKPPSPDTGAYRRARAKLPERVLQRLAYGVADQLESRVPADWLWLGRHVKAGDGTTLTAPDTEENQGAWPQSRAQKPGLGFPILRMVVLFSLATAAVSGVAVGPCKGKQTGESALFRTLLDRLQPGDVFLGDCGFCSYALLALLLLRRRGCRGASTPASAHRFSSGPPPGQGGSHCPVGTPVASELDGRGDLRRDPGDAFRP